MSEEQRLNDTDPPAQVARELRARLRGLAPEEIVELAAQLLTTYVIEGVLPLARAGEGDLATDAVGEESFAQLLKRLKSQKKDPVLDRFLVDGENISVRIEGQGVLPVTDYRRPTAPPPGPGAAPSPEVRREGVPGAAASPYNRALYQPEDVPQRAAQPAPRVPSNPPTQPAPQQPASQQQQKQEPQRDRFSLIELE